MNRFAMLAALGIFASVQASRAIDFTPIRPSNESPAMRRFPRILFSDGERRVSYVPPPGWTFSGSPAGFRLEADDASHSVATVQQIARRTPPRFDVMTIEALTKAMRTALPPGSTDVRVTATDLNPLRLAGYETLEITLSYFAVGKERMQSVLFVNLAETQLQFSLTALRGDFAAAHEKFRRSFYSWQWLD